VETNNNILLTIDVGSTEICAIISEIKGIDERGNPIPRMIGVGTTPSLGIKKGAVTNIEQASKAIAETIQSAERIAGKNVTEAVVSISGAYVSSIESHGIINVPEGEISLVEIKRVMSTAVYNGRIHDTYEILHVLPFSFKVDDQEGVEDPLGMNASRLEVRVNIITVQKTQINNMKRAVESAQLKVKNFVLDSYASLIATVSEDEKNHGVCLIDLGGEISSFVIYALNQSNKQ
jgi:cell division protein FtsA